MSFAVIDFETTGLAPERAARVVEVGVALTDSDGHVEREWTTLLKTPAAMSEHRECTES
ncbi:MAG: hypothetical protein ACPGXI_06005 [Mycobacterium sp.]